MRGRRQRARTPANRLRLGDPGQKTNIENGPAEPLRYDSAALAEEIGLAALGLARRANAAGLTALGYLLECVALEAGAQAVARRWPSDPAER